jgi:hypothetical protein
MTDHFVRGGIDGRQAAAGGSLMEPPVDWQAEVRRLRAQGKSSDEIAMALDKSPSAVREALRGTRRTPLAALGAGQSMVKAHVPRVPRAPLDRAVLQTAALAFAAGEITKDELMRRISR